jgi:hypothetical protein
VYGNELTYPIDENAKRFAELIGQKTFKPRHLEIIKALGFEIELINAYELNFGSLKSDTHAIGKGK